MKNKILKLAKRLETFKLEDIESIMGEGIEDVLQELVKDGQLNLVGEIYSYKSERKLPLPFCFKFHSQEKIEMITKCFYAGVKSKQASFLLDIGDATMQNFYKHFRQMIYERQLNALKTHFEQKSKIAKMRRFYDIPVYFYLYNDELFVADKPLKTKQKKLPHTRRIFTDKSSLLPPPPLNKPLPNETKPRTTCCRAYLEVQSRVDAFIHAYL